MTADTESTTLPSSIDGAPMLTVDRRASDGMVWLKVPAVPGVRSGAVVALDQEEAWQLALLMLGPGDAVLKS